MLRHKFLIKKWNVWNDPTFNAICFMHTLYFIWHGAKLWTYFLLKSSILNWIVGNKLAPARLTKFNLFVNMRGKVSCNMNVSLRRLLKCMYDIVVYYEIWEFLPIAGWKYIEIYIIVDGSRVIKLRYVKTGDWSLPKSFKRWCFQKCTQIFFRY